MTPRVRAGTLLPSTKPVKHKTGKSFRASKQAAPVPPPPLPSASRRAVPLSPTEVACLYILQHASPYAVTARLLHEELPLWSLHDVATALQRLAKRGRLLIHEPATDPADIKWKLLPDKCPSIPMVPIPLGVLNACTLELVRPPRPDGCAGVQRQVPVKGGERSYAPLGCVIALLVPGEPYELRRDGRTVFRHEGSGWQDRPRLVVSIRATLANGCEVVHGFPSPPSPLDGCLIVPTMDGQAIEVHFDGKLILTDPAA